MVAGRLAIRMISVVSTLILARLLVPQDFGVVALASAVFAIAETILATGYTVLLVRNDRVDRDAYDTAWTMNLIRCLLLATITVASAPLQAWAFGDPRIGNVLFVVAATVALEGLMSIGMARAQRELRFDVLFKHQVAGRLLAFVFTAVLAVLMGNYWCLVLGNLIAKVLTVPYSYMLAPHRPRLSLVHWRGFLHFSKWMFGFNICAAVDGQVTNLSLGAMVGVVAVGQYNVAYQISATPVTEIAVPVRQPLYAGYAQVKDDAARLRDHFLQSLGLVAAVTVPLSVGIALVAPEVERIALGPNWVGTAPLIALCALFALTDSLVQFTHNVFLLKDRLRPMVLLCIAMVLVRAPLVVLGIWWDGAFGMLVALLATSVLSLAVWHVQVARLLGHRLRAAWAQVLRPAIAATLMTAAALALRLALPADTPGILDDLWRLAAVAAVGASVHIVAQAGLWWCASCPDGPERRALALLRSARRRHGVAGPV